MRRRHACSGNNRSSQLALHGERYGYGPSVHKLHRSPTRCGLALGWGWPPVPVWGSLVGDPSLCCQRTVLCFASRRAAYSKHLGYSSRHCGHGAASLPIGALASPTWGRPCLASGCVWTVSCLVRSCSGGRSIIRWDRSDVPRCDRGSHDGRPAPDHLLRYGREYDEARVGYVRLLRYSVRPCSSIRLCRPSTRHGIAVVGEFPPSFAQQTLLPGPANSLGSSVRRLGRARANWLIRI